MDLLPADRTRRLLVLHDQLGAVVANGSVATRNDNSVYSFVQAYLAKPFILGLVDHGVIPSLVLVNVELVLDVCKT